MLLQYFGISERRANIRMNKIAYTKTDLLLYKEFISHMQPKGVLKVGFFLCIQKKIMVFKTAG